MAFAFDATSARRRRRRPGFAPVAAATLLPWTPTCRTTQAKFPRFLAVIEKGYDVVSGWKRIGHDPWHKVLPSRVFNGLVSFVTGVPLHDHNCGMKCYRAEVFTEVRLYGELHRFIPVLAAVRLPRRRDRDQSSAVPTRVRQIHGRWPLRQRLPRPVDG